MTATLLLSVVIFLLVLWKTFSYRTLLQLPLADGTYPIIGHCWLGLVKERYLFETFTKIIKLPKNKNEAITKLKFGFCEIIVCADPEYGYTLMNSFLKKDSLYKFFHIVGANGLITADATTWKVHRKLLNPTLSQSVLDTYLTEFNKYSRQLVQLMEQELDKGPFDQLLYLKSTVLQSAVSTLVGIDLQEDKHIIEESERYLGIIMTCITKRCFTFFLHYDIIFNMSNLKKIQDTAEDAINNILLSWMIKKKKSNSFSSQDHKDADMTKDEVTGPPKLKSLIDHLLAMGEKNIFIESEIREELATFLGAAFDTTYQTLGMILLTIGSYPSVQKKIFSELHSVFEGSKRDVQKQDLAKLKYLEATIKETMRLLPVVPLIGRTLDKDFKLENNILPAGSRCYVSLYHVGRHHVWGEDAEQFRPERWLNGSLPKHSGAAFGLGKRSCIGSNYAMMMMKTVICHVVRSYWISGDVTKLVRAFEPVVKPLSGHHISIKKHENSDTV